MLRTRKISFLCENIQTRTVVDILVRAGRSVSDTVCGGVQSKYQCTY